MKVFITGISGLLGINAAHICLDRHDVSGCWYRHPVTLPGADLVFADLVRPGVLEGPLRRINPDVILHTAGLTNVDACEEHPVLAQRLNVDLSASVARAAKAVRARLVHISSDHLFSGTVPWQTEEDHPTPINVYASTKAEAEQAVLSICPDALVVRTNFYGWGSPLRMSFSDWILAGLTAGGVVRMFHDIYFTPMLVHDLVDAILMLVDRRATGIYHVAGSQRLSKREFGMLVARVFEFPTDLIRPISIEDFPLKARRPRDMSLATAKAATALGKGLPAAEAGLRRLRRLRDEGWPVRIARSFPVGAESISPDTAR